MGFNNELVYRPNFEAAQIIGAANPFGMAAKTLGDSADRIRADKVADSEIGYKIALAKSTSDENTRKSELHPEALVKAKKENIKLDDDHAQAGEALIGTQFDNEFKKKSNPLKVEGLKLGNDNLTAEIEGRRIANKWAPEMNKAEIGAKNASAYASTTGANLAKYDALDPYGIKKATALYYTSGAGLKDATQKKFDNSLLQ